MHKGGRKLYAVVPSWLSDFGDYPAFDSQGRRNILEIVGNMPGRREAGRIWQTRLDRFYGCSGLH